MDVPPHGNSWKGSTALKSVCSAKCSGGRWQHILSQGKKRKKLNQNNTQNNPKPTKNMVYPIISIIIMKTIDSTDQITHKFGNPFKVQDGALSNVV